MCFNFGLSMRITQDSSVHNNYLSTNTSNFTNELMRIEWPVKSKNDYFDPRQKLSVVLEFKSSMKELYKEIKFLPFAYLIHETTNATIYPS